MKLRRSSRQRADREVFAPNKYEKNMSYELNEKRAMAKKIEATSRESDVKIEHKRGTLVLTFTTAAYELYKQGIYKYDRDHPQLRCVKSYKTSKTNQQSIKKAINEESLSIKHNNSEK